MALSTIGANQIASVNSASMPAGSVLQVVVANGPNSDVSFTGSTFTDINLSASITPLSTSNKILVKCNFVAASNNSGAGSYALGLKILRGTTGIYETFRTPWAGSVSAIGQMAHLEYLDSPATTSATTYKVQAKNGASSGNVTAHMGNSNAQIILMEIAG